MGRRKVTAIRVHFKNGGKTRKDLDIPVMIDNLDQYRFKLMEEYKADYIFLEYEEVVW